MGLSLGEMVESAFAQARGETVGGERILPIFVLESTTRFGLDERAQWVAQRPGAQVLVRFGAEGLSPFFEAVENPRAALEALIAEGSAALGLDETTVILSFPTVDIARALLGGQSPHFCRVALLWLVPTELRALRSEIAAVAGNHLLPRPLRDFAARLVVPE